MEPANLRVLIVSNIDSAKVDGRFTRPFYLGKALADLPATEVGHVAPNPERVDYGPTWAPEAGGVINLRKALALAVQEFAPDVVYGHQNMPAVAALTIPSLRVVADVHSVPSIEWKNLRQSTAGQLERLSSARRQLIAHSSERLISKRASGVVFAGDECGQLFRQAHRPAVPGIVVQNGVTPRITLRGSRQRPGAGPFDPNTTNLVAVIPADASPSNLAALHLLAESARVIGEMSGGSVRVHVLGSDGGPGADAINYHGFVEEMIDWLEAADAVLLPYPSSVPLAGGARNKLLEALQYGKRVVSTAEGFRGLRDATAQPDVYVAGDSAHEFARDALTAIDTAPTIGDIDRRVPKWTDDAEVLREFLNRLRSSSPSTS